MAPIRAPMLKKPSLWHPFTRLLNSSTFIVSTIIDLKLVDIHGTSFLCVSYNIILIIIINMWAASA